MDVVAVDERTGGAEVSFPVYRVYFFDRLYGVLSSGDAYTYEITGANNVQQVLAWADASARGRTYAVYAVVSGEWDPQRGRSMVTLLQLAGDDPNNTASDRAAPLPSLQAPAEQAQVQQMNERRQRARAKGGPGPGVWVDG